MTKAQEQEYKEFYLKVIAELAQECNDLALLDLICRLFVKSKANADKE